MTPLPPVRREIDVPVDPVLAFEVFTERIGAWWPLAEHGVFGAGARVAFEDRQLVERSSTGEMTVWGEVNEWEPGARVAFTWHPGDDAERATQVEVTFNAIAGGTRVTLLHSGWEVYANPSEARHDYERGWPGVLARFGKAASTANSAARDD